MHKNPDSTLQKWLILLAAFTFLPFLSYSQCSLSSEVVLNNAVSCFQGMDGNATVTASGGQVPYSYLWDNSETPSTVSNLSEGNHTVTVTDADNCTASSSIYIPAPTQLDVNISFPLGETCILCEGSFLASGTGGTPPYSYLWSTGETTDQVADLCPGTYGLTVTDANLCTFETDVTYTDLIQLEISADTIIHACNNCDGSINLELPNSGPFTFTWSNSSTSQSLSNLCPGNYTVTVSNSEGCVDIVTFEIGTGCVWPGDANYDGVADNNDIIALGISYGANGPTRAGATLDWVGQAADDWTDNLPSGANYKHSDCDGNGMVEYADTLAVSLNYGKPAHPLFAKQPKNEDSPVLYFEIDQDTIQGGDTILVDILYGTDSQSAPQTYGLALSVVYDENIVKAGHAMADFSTSWIGTPSETIFLAKEFPGQTDLGIARNDQTNISGFGKIASLSLVIQDNIDGLQLLSNNLELNFANVRIVDFSETPLDFTPIHAEVVIAESPSAITQLPDNALQIFPNPAKTWVQVDAGSLNIESITLYNLLGKVVLQRNAIEASSLQITTKELPMGSYFMRVVTDKGELNKTMVIIN